MAETAAAMEAAGTDIATTSIAVRRHLRYRHHRLEAEASHVHHAQDSTCLTRGFVANVASP